MLRERSIITGSVGNPVSESCNISSNSTRSTRSVVAARCAVPRATAARTRCATSSASAGQRNHSSTCSSMARRRAVSSAQPTMTGMPQLCARSVAKRSTVGSDVVTSIARTPERAATAFANSPGVTRSRLQPSRRLSASATEASLESVSSSESLTTSSKVDSRRLGALHGEIPLHRIQQRWKVERLLDVIVGADLQRFALVLPLVERGHHHDTNRAAQHGMLLHDAADLPAVAARHHHIEKHERGPDRLEQSERLVAVVRDGDRVSPNLEILTDDL